MGDDTKGVLNASTNIQIHTLPDLSCTQCIAWITFTDVAHLEMLLDRFFELCIARKERVYFHCEICSLHQVGVDDSLFCYVCAQMVSCNGRAQLVLCSMGEQRCHRMRTLACPQANPATEVDN
jgi:hypothetical protein